MVSFELLFRDITTTNLSNIQNETIKSKLRDTAFSSLTSFDKNKPKNNLTKAELHALNSLKQNNDLIIQKADKGNTVVIIDKDAYKTKMKSLISDPSKFKKLDIQNDEHKDNCPSLRPILSAIGTPTYDLAKFLVPILKPLTENEYTVHDSFSFANDVRKLSSKNLMASLDVESLFTNIPLEETIT